MFDSLLLFTEFDHVMAMSTEDRVVDFVMLFVVPLFFLLLLSITVC